MPDGNRASTVSPSSTGARIRELETSVLEEQERTNAFREQVQAANGRLVQVVRDVRDRTDRILTECGAVVEDVAQDLAEKGQGHVVPSDPKEDLEEDPEEERVAPAESVGSASNYTPSLGFLRDFVR